MDTLEQKWTWKGIGLGGIGIFGVSFCLSFIFIGSEPMKDMVASIHPLPEEEPATEFLLGPIIPKAPLEAKSALAIDLISGEVLYEHNPDEVYPLASLTKVMTAITAKELNVGPKVSIGLKAIQTEGDSGFKAGEEWNLDDLLRFTLVSSSNDGAAAVALAFENETHLDFVDLMNETAMRLNLPTLHFENPTGLDEDWQTPGGKGSARDIANLLSYATREHPEILSASGAARLDVTSTTSGHVAENTNTELANLSGVISSKTGWSELASGNVALIVDQSFMRPAAVVILGSTREGRLADAKSIIEAIRLRPQ